MDKKIIGIDFGTKIIGLAIKNKDISFPVPYGQFSNDKNGLNELIETIEFESPSIIVIGYPSTFDNYLSSTQQKVIDFKQFLESQLSKKIEFHFFDESFSTVESQNSLKNFNIKTSKLEKNKDAIAASIILERFLKRRIR